MQHRVLPAKLVVLKLIHGFFQEDLLSESTGVMCIN